MTGIEHSIGSYFAHKISDYAEANSLSNVLEEISIYGSSNPDGSHVISFEWNGWHDSGLANLILDFLHKIKALIVNSGKEAKEQVAPHMTLFKDPRRCDPDAIQALYRVRVWDEQGKYEVLEKELISR